MLRVVLLFFAMIYSNIAFATKQIDIYSMFSPGAGGTIMGIDIVNRMNAAQNEYEFRLATVPGAAGDNAALRAIASARAGQDILIWQGTGSYTFGKYASANPNAYDRDNDLVPIASFVGTQFHIMVEPESEIKTLSELVNSFRNKDVVYFGSTTTNPITPFLNVIFLKSNDLKPAKELNYTAPFDIAKSVLTKESNYTIFPPSDVRGLKSIVSSGSTRSKSHPDVPTGKELGMSDFNFASTLLFAVPKEKQAFGVKFEKMLLQICQDPEFASTAEKIGYEVKCVPGEPLKNSIRAESDLIKKYEKDVTWKR